jgi:hypothetical protein
MSLNRDLSATLPERALDGVSRPPLPCGHLARQSGPQAAEPTMKCPQCGQDNAVGSKLCLQCGARFAAPCASCGHDLPGGGLAADLRLEHNHGECTVPVWVSAVGFLIAGYLAVHGLFGTENSHDGKTDRAHRRSAHHTRPLRRAARRCDTANVVIAPFHSTHDHLRPRDRERVSHEAAT